MTAITTGGITMRQIKLGRDGIIVSTYIEFIIMKVNTFKPKLVPISKVICSV